MARTPAPAPAGSTTRTPGGIAALFPPVKPARVLPDDLFPVFATATLFYVFVGESKGNHSEWRCTSLAEAFAKLTEEGCQVSAGDQAAAARTLTSRRKVGYRFHRERWGQETPFIGGITRREEAVRPDGKKAGLFERFPGLDDVRTGQNYSNMFYRLFVPDAYRVGNGPDAHFSQAELDYAMGWGGGYWHARCEGTTPTEGGTYYTYACAKD